MSKSDRDDASSESAPHTALIVLAAGAGMRMKSELAKPLHPLAGLTMVEHVLAAGAAIEPDITIVVASPQTADIPERIGRPDIVVVRQEPPRGTGEAVRLALEAAPEVERCVVLYADHPLLTREVIVRLAAALDRSDVKAAVLTMIAEPGTGYGRIERDDENRVTRIVERRDDADRSEPYEANSGMMALNARWALEQLKQLPPSPKTNEWYLTDLVELAAGEATDGGVWPVVTVTETPELLLGINDRVELATAERLLLARIQTEHMRNGVTIRQPQTVTIEQGVSIGADTVIEPGTIIRRETAIGRRCVIGPNTVIDASTIGDDVRIVASVVEGATVGDGTDVGPFAHLRPGADLAGGVHIGNFVEIKQSRIERGVRAGHFSYLGDARIGAGSNIGAGTVTANYDGAGKHQTIIGENVFIGSDTMLVAPVEIGDGARTGAGSVVTRDVAPGVSVMGVPARPRIPEPPELETSGEHEA